ncbi:MAG: hypothetical protein ACRDT6_16810 [Micromonosporaceae bacterium]
MDNAKAAQILINAAYRLIKGARHSGVEPRMIEWHNLYEAVYRASQEKGAVHPHNDAAHVLTMFCDRAPLDKYDRENYDGDQKTVRVALALWLNRYMPAEVIAEMERVATEIRTIEAA